jgi:hypothetical protein
LESAVNDREAVRNFFLKMGTKEILDREDGLCIRLYKRGLFWTAYEESAFVILQHKSFQIRSEFVRTVSRIVISIGFPEQTRLGFEEIFGVFVFEDKQKGYWSSQVQFNQSDFEGWRKKQLSEETDSPIIKPFDNEIIIDKIRNWHLSDKTPMQAMVFIQELQSLLNGKAR